VSTWYKSKNITLKLVKKKIARDSPNMVPLFYNLNNEKHPLNHEDIHFLHPRQSTRGSQPKQWSTWMCTMKSWGGGGGIGTSLEKKKETKKS